MSQSAEIAVSRTPDDLSEPVTYGVEAYTSPQYARAEHARLWRKVWQQVGRLEEIPEVGSYLTYDIQDDSVLIVRTAPDSIRAFYNVCSHRGRRLVDTPQGAKGACGKQKQFVCGFHGWSYNLEGLCNHVPNKDDWNGALTEERTRLGEIKVDTWGGWIWVNFDANCEPLRAYLSPRPASSTPSSFTRCASGGAAGSNSIAIGKLRWRRSPRPTMSRRRTRSS